MLPAQLHLVHIEEAQRLQAGQRSIDIHAGQPSKLEVGQRRQHTAFQLHSAPAGKKEGLQALEVFKSFAVCAAQLRLGRRGAASSSSGSTET